MKTYLRFENGATGRAIEMKVADSDPGKDWYVAPKNYDGAKLWQRVDGKIIELDPAVLEAERLTTHKAEAKNRLEGMAEQKRLQYITPGDAKIMVYQEKARQADAYLNAPDGSYPTLEAEAAVRSMSVADLATEVRAKRDAWQAIAGAIEAKTIEVKALIEASDSLQDVESALDFDWGI